MTIGKVGGEILDTVADGKVVSEERQRVLRAAQDAKLDEVIKWANNFEPTAGLSPNKREMVKELISEVVRATLAREIGTGQIPQSAVSQLLESYAKLDVWGAMFIVPGCDTQAVQEQFVLGVRARMRDNVVPFPAKVILTNRFIKDANELHAREFRPDKSNVPILKPIEWTQPPDPPPLTMQEIREARRDRLENPPSECIDTQLAPFLSPDFPFALFKTTSAADPSQPKWLDRADYDLLKSSVKTVLKIADANPKKASAIIKSSNDAIAAIFPEAGPIFRTIANQP
ncbi:hypothetical protein ACFL6C_14570 [Myxococcota bacterium]